MLSLRCSLKSCPPADFVVRLVIHLLSNKENKCQHSAAPLKSSAPIMRFSPFFSYAPTELMHPRKSCCYTYAPLVDQREPTTTAAAAVKTPSPARAARPPSPSHADIDRQVGRVSVYPPLRLYFCPCTSPTVYCNSSTVPQLSPAGSQRRASE